MTAHPRRPLSVQVLALLAPAALALAGTPPAAAPPPSETARAALLLARVIEFPIRIYAGGGFAGLIVAKAALVAVIMVALGWAP